MLYIILNVRLYVRWFVWVNVCNQIFSIQPSFLVSALRVVSILAETEIPLAVVPAFCSSGRPSSFDYVLEMHSFRTRFSLAVMEAAPLLYYYWLPHTEHAHAADRFRIRFPGDQSSHRALVAVIRFDESKGGEISRLASATLYYIHSPSYLNFGHAQVVWGAELMNISSARVSHIGGRTPSSGGKCVSIAFRAHHLSTEWASSEEAKDGDGKFPDSTVVPSYDATTHLDSAAEFQGGNSTECCTVPVVNESSGLMVISWILRLSTAFRRSFYRI